MNRRELLLVLGGTIAVPHASRAQQKAMPVVGILNIFSPPTNPGEVARGPIAQGLNQAGFVEGKNVAIERRWAEFHYDRLPALAVTSSPARST